MIDPVRVIIAHAMVATNRKPAIFSAGTPMPKNCRITDPSSSDTASTAKTPTPVMSAMRRCCATVLPCVTLRNTGIVPIGLQIVNSATAAVTRVASSMSGSLRRASS
jgi:hypothetical protein